MDDLIKLVQESVDRTRRIETRLTKYLTSIGFETGAKRPEWVDGAIEAPSVATSLADLLSVIPEGWGEEDEVTVMFRGQPIGGILKP